MKSTGGEGALKEKGNLKGWLTVIGIAVIFLIWALFAYFMIGQKKQGPWDFGTIEDVPGESVYSTDRAGARGTPPPKQHVSDPTPGKKFIKGE